MDVVYSLFVVVRLS